MKKKLLLTTTTLLLSITTFCQTADTTLLKPALSRLAIMGDSIIKGSNDTARLESNQSFSLLLDSILNLKSSEYLSFHEVKALSILKSPDNAFVIYNWMCQTYFPYPQYKYFGYLRTLSKNGSSIKLYTFQVFFHWLFRYTGIMTQKHHLLTRTDCHMKSYPPGITLNIH